MLLRAGGLASVLTLMLFLGACTRDQPAGEMPHAAGSTAYSSSTSTAYFAGEKPAGSNTGPHNVRLRFLDGSKRTTLLSPYASPSGCAYWDGHEVITTKDGCTLKGVAYSGQFRVRNNDTTLLDDRVVGRGTEESNDIVLSVNWGSGHYTGTKIVRSDIFGSSRGSLYCVAGFDFTLIADEVQGCVHLFNLYGQDDHVAIQGCYLHTPKAAPADHVELLYASPGASDITLIGNSWYMTPAGSPTAALFLDGTNEDSNWIIRGNWFDGQEPISSNWNSIQADTTGITFQDNQMGVHSAYGPYLFNDHPPSVSGRNVWMYSASTPATWSTGFDEVNAGVEVPGV